MITVNHLTKRFGATLAVDDIQFEIPQGQVVGFLGPNGAGKTTTMRVLTGYLPPDDGSAQLLGMDLTSQSLDIRKRLGYLPENNPLPDDIEVTDYLHFVGKMRGLSDVDARMARVKKVLKSCSLGGVIGKKISELSKGYRQRVGLAQAIVHDPDILILDEPTSGLDPNQVQEVRGLIHQLKAQKTLILSTHILSEVQHTCDRVLIINKGKIVADGKPTELANDVQNVNKLFVALKGPQDSIEKALSELGGIKKIARHHDESLGEDGFMLETAADQDVRDALFNLVSSHKWPVLALQQRRLSLEEVFRALTRTQTSTGESHE